MKDKKRPYPDYKKKKGKKKKRGLMENIIFETTVTTIRRK